MVALQVVEEAVATTEQCARGVDFRLPAARSDDGDGSEVRVGLRPRRRVDDVVMDLAGTDPTPGPAAGRSDATPLDEDGQQAPSGVVRLLDDHWPPSSIGRLAGHGQVATDANQSAPCVGR